MSRRPRRIVVSLSAVIGLLLATLAGLSGSASAAASEPCDIYAAGGTPCAAAYSTVRALFAAYDGPLYQVTRASDGATMDVGPLAAGGYANASAQDQFCNDTTCTITKVYDQTPDHNDLVPGPAGGAGLGADKPADASEIAVTAGGHKVYGVWISPQHGYRFTGVAARVAVNGEPEGAYMVTSGTHVNSACCFDFGNAESTPTDNGNGHMDAVSITTSCTAPCTGSGPWVEADMENGLFMGANGANLANLGNKTTYVTAMLKNNGQTTYALRGGNSQSGGLKTWWNGAEPNEGGYQPMHQEGGIILGTGGDNSNWNRGTFFEGVMVSGYPTFATENAVQANIVSVGYHGETNVPNGPEGIIGGPGGTCTDVIGDDTGVTGTTLDLWSCQSYAEDQHWSHFPDGTLRTIGYCMDVTGNAASAGTPVEIANCDGTGGEVWAQQANGSLMNPQSGMCLDAAGGSTSNGTALQIEPCNGSAEQQFSVTDGSPIVGPGGQCADVLGDDTGVNGTQIDIWTCQSYARDQHWFYNTATQALHTLGRCMDLTGNATAAGTLVQLYTCNGTTGEKWAPQANGSLMNPQSGLCLDATGGSTANGTRLEIEPCNGSAEQHFPLS
ncbi:MAG TPA: arabinofuranosidase catalytic domain-containing protein [Streptosporangiaceae bacterium]|nr:arabinofuranosidase catalytic domain-containing protein [Streptosporangiaceae bacterium]